MGRILDENERDPVSEEYRKKMEEIEYNNKVYERSPTIKYNLDLID